jgi:nitrate reductase NapD
LEGVDIHGGVEQGKLVVTLETQSEGEIVERLNRIQALEGVLAANLVFHHVEPALGRG